MSPISKPWYGKLATTSGMTWSSTSSQMVSPLAFTPSSTTLTTHVPTNSGEKPYLSNKKSTFISRHEKRHSNYFGSTKKPTTTTSKPRDPNTMDTTPGRTRARKAKDDEEEHNPPPYLPRGGLGTHMQDMLKVK